MMRRIKIVFNRNIELNFQEFSIILKKIGLEIIKITSSGAYVEAEERQLIKLFNCKFDVDSNRILSFTIPNQLIDIVQAIYEPIPPNRFNNNNKMKEVLVRFVPKPDSGLSIEFENKNPDRTKQTILKSASNFQKMAIGALDKIGINASPTSQNAIVSSLSENQFSKIFNNKLTDEKKIQSFGSTKIEKEFLSTNEKLRLPDSLKEIVEFAYIPTPIQEFYERSIPPKYSHHYFSLDDILSILEVYQCHQSGWKGEGIKLAMIDSGFSNHPFYNGKGYQIQKYSTINNYSPQEDISGHGTGESANILAIAPKVQFIGIKHNDYASLAIENALEQNPRIISNSWGWNIDQQSKLQLQALNPNQYYEMIDLENIISNAVLDGKIFLFAGGNGHYAFPASMPNVLAIGGVYIDEKLELYASNYASSFESKLFPGRKVPDFCGVVGNSGDSPQKGHIMLPVPGKSSLAGENMLNGTSNYGWGVFSGTSASCPQIAAIVALMLSINPNLEFDNVKHILSASAKDITKGVSAHGERSAKGNDKATGAGLISAFKACNNAKDYV